MNTDININNSKFDNKNLKNNAKEILNSLLKGMLEHKLNKLEKKNIEESKSLKIMSKISQNIILTLDHYSHKVRKEIYKIRHKNDENGSKKNVNESSKKISDLNKTMFKDDKSNKINFDHIKNNELLINNYHTNFLESPTKHKKRPNKSIDAKKYKSLFPDIIPKPKEKSAKKEKMDVFSRLASKTIGNFKKLKLGTNENTNNKEHNLFSSSSRSKLKKLTSSTKNIHNIFNNKNEGEKNSERSPSNKEKNQSSKLNTNAISTPKMKQKDLNKISHITLENNNVGTESAKKKIKKHNSKGKLTHRLSKTMYGLKKEEKKNIESSNKLIIKKTSSKIDISSENNDKNNGNKNTELKVTNNNEKIKKLLSSNKDIKSSIKEKLLLDEEMIKDVNKDELLVSYINEEEKINEINEISALNLDDLNIKDDININNINNVNNINNISNINNVNNIDNANNIDNVNNIDNANNIDNINNIDNVNLENIENNQNYQEIPLMKKSSVEFNSSVNSSNNLPTNNIKPIKSNIQSIENTKNSNINSNNNITQSQNNTSENNNISKSSNNINNIIISHPKNSPTNFLGDDAEINFTLVEDSHIDENDNDLNKTIDLNISGLSDQLALEEKFETHLDEISRYLDIRDLCNIMLLNKECYTTIMNVLISKTEITIDILEEEINKLKDSNKSMDFDKIVIQPFKLSSNSSRAISLLNNSPDCSLIKFDKNESINREIFIVFGIFFIASGKKKEYLKLNGEDEKINFITNYFQKDIKNMSLGSLIEKEINGKIFDDDIIASLYKYSNKYINIITPNRFQKTNKDVAIFVFVVKNILEHIGALDQQNIKPDKEYILYNARLNNSRILLEELNKFYEKIN